MVKTSSVRARWVAAVAGLMVSLSSTVALTAPATADTDCATTQRHNPAAKYLCAKTNDLVDVRIGDVLPTQPSLGYDEVYYKLGRYTLGKDTVNKKFDDWCESNGQVSAATVTAASTLRNSASFTCSVAIGKETTESIANMKTVVIGPGGKLYLTDGHHTLTSFYETPDAGADTHIRLKVLGNLSAQPMSTFWDTMQKNGWAWLKDVNGRTIKPAQLPKSVGLANFANDKYRGLLYFGRDIGYSQNSLPFQEFYWGAWVRDGKAVPDWNAKDLTSYLSAVETMTRAQVALGANGVVAEGKTAGDLGVLSAWNAGSAATAGEFAKLSKPYSDAKPGKLAYAIEYKARNGK
ncbi:ParB/Srx family N-terminal domain-containing protein [Nocardia macrotermitis]|uniref:Chromosome partitioning protein ParB n=1 Tax=Nocardia macrotermitis TaxID=2585198 RepID=A0A7K0D1Q3_9NOCA|nr:ParB/Srx family N-terminal domain-containing protein [Nocardia macrotermitis]MQY19656.1 hypothetical protein [Nocardia macrotermitis]